MKMTMMLIAGAAVAAATISAPALAQVSQTTGSGSAVTTVNASADFESQAALVVPYTENGLLFTSVGLSQDNNGCGFAGCKPAYFSYFAGNYEYGFGNGYFQIQSVDGTAFAGLEFMAGTGYGNSTSSVVWQAFSNNVLVGSGSTYVSNGTVVGFSGSNFDTFTYTDDGSRGGNAPAFDSVKAQFASATGAVPEPATWAMMLAGFGMIGLAARKRSAVKTTVAYA